MVCRIGSVGGLTRQLYSEGLSTLTGTAAGTNGQQWRDTSAREAQALGLQGDVYGFYGREPRNSFLLRETTDLVKHSSHSAHLSEPVES